MNIYIKILDFLAENDNGKYIDITSLHENFDFLLLKSRELSQAKRIEIKSTGVYVFGTLEKTTIIGDTTDLKKIQAKILLAGHEYLKETKESTQFNLNASSEKSLSPMETKKSWKIFISHATKDKEVTTKFCDLILGSTLNIRREEIFNTSHHGTKPITGENFKTRIKQELTDAKIILQFISKAYKESEVCLIEMGAAWILSNNVIPLIVEPGNYDFGFVHSETQQAQLHNEQHIIKLIDDLKKMGIYNDDVSSLVVLEKTREFITWLTQYDKINHQAESNSRKKITNENDFDTDLEVIRTYLLSKNFQKITLKGLAENINEKYDLNYIINLIEKFPLILTRVKINGEPGIKLLYPKVENEIYKPF